MARPVTERMSDVAKTALMREAIRDLHPQYEGNGEHSPLSASWALLDEVADRTGFHGGFADVLAFHLWPSRRDLIGYEIKASRSDLRREIASPEKALRFSTSCTEWRLVVWDRRWVEGDGSVPGIPESWSVYAWDEEKRSLVRVRKGQSSLYPTELPTSMVAAMVRRAVESGVGAHVLRSAVLAARDEGARAGKTIGVNEVLDVLLPLFEQRNKGRSYNDRLKFSLSGVKALVAELTTEAVAS